MTRIPRVEFVPLPAPGGNGVIDLRDAGSAGVRRSATDPPARPVSGGPPSGGPPLEGAGAGPAGAGASLSGPAAVDDPVDDDPSEDAAPDPSGAEDPEHDGSEGPPGPGGALPPGGRAPVPLSRRLWRPAVGAVVALALGVVGSTAVQLVADARARDAMRLDRAADAAAAVRTRGDEVYGALVDVAVDAPGAEALSAVRRRAAALADADLGPASGVVPVSLAEALRERDRYLAAVRIALDDEADGGADGVSGRLGLLDDRHDDFVAAWDDLRADVRRAAEDRRDDVGRLRTAAALVLVPAFAVAASLLWVLRRRLRLDLDEPIAGLRGAAAAWAAGRAGQRTGLTPDTDLGALGHELDGATAANARRMRRLRQQAEWGAQSRMIFEALDLVETEGEAHEVAERALQLIDPVVPVEFLLSPHGSRELFRVASNRSVPIPGCPVPATDACPAIRRGQTAVWESSESINACPRLRGRPQGPCSGVCVPVTVAGRPVGVIHATGRDRRPPPERFNTQLGTLSTQLGNRLGALRALESSRQDAATDTLTALPNRRLLEAELGGLIEGAVPFVLVLADLDRFKALNDTFGHEVGDRALQLFAQVLRDKVRGNDVVARYGGEEFVLVYPRMSLTTSIEAIERIRDALALALEDSSLPEFTCSFGITHSSVGHSAEAILRVADAGLLRAKELGGDQVVFADETLAARMFGDDV